ncbi:TauD/TfdA family dioxygenase [Streptomyces cinnamoneus]|uniref:TauD/TfdA family dioxygenase n=1 Tax=Streptomyces cinnamoneus TaxID=53446 RepID=UPI0033E448FC
MTLPAHPAFDRFARHRLDVRQADVFPRLRGLLQRDGLVVVDGLTRLDVVAQFADRVMNRNRACGPYGLHEVQPGRYLRQEAVDRTRAPMNPHTAGAHLKLPPRLVLVVCARSADTGGSSLLVDGQDLLSHFAREWLDDVGPLTRRSTMWIAPGVSSPVFRLSQAGHCVLRLPSRPVLWSVAARHRREKLHVAAECTQRLLSLEAGQGYLLDNWRWAHGRTAFDGERLLYRVEGTPRFQMPAGFPTRVGAP